MRPVVLLRCRQAIEAVIRNEFPNDWHIDTSRHGPIVVIEGPRRWASDLDIAEIVRQHGAEYFVSESEFGRRLVSFSDWVDGIEDNLVDLARKYEVSGLELRPNGPKRTWGSHTLSFVSRLPRLASFGVIDHFLIDDSGVQSLKGLRRLSIETVCKNVIDFSCFPLLEDCTLIWRRRCESLFDRVSLKNLTLAWYKGSDLSAFRRLEGLRDLELIAGTLASLNGIELLTKLQSLALKQLRNLSNITHVSNARCLRRLSISWCSKVGDLSPLRALEDLEDLGLSSDKQIQSLHPVSRLPHLRSVRFPGTTNIVDGDILVLAHLPNLSDLGGFQNRKHYNFRRNFNDSGEELAAALRDQAKPSAQ
jgi:hypothetical protein